MVTSFSQFTLIKVKKIFRKSQPQFWEKLRELRLRRNSSLLIKKRVFVNLVYLVQVFHLLGYGFVDFDNPHSAQRAVAALQSKGVQAQMARVNSCPLTLFYFDI